MSDIVIRGIEMPKDKPLNLSIYPNGEVVLFCIKGRDEYDNECNYGDYEHKKIAVELPEHGRLGDLDKLLPESGYDPMMFKPKYGGDHRTQYNTLMGYEILGIVEDAPTILEASNEEMEK